MPVDFRAIFQSLPGLYLILQPDPPRYTICAVSNAYAQATMTTREGIIGRGLFEVFPDNPNDTGATGVSNLSASLEHVMTRREPHTMALQKYDIRRPSGEFEERYWSPVNCPVFADDGSIAYVVHRVEDVTEFVRLKQSNLQRGELNEQLNRRIDTMMAEVYRHEVRAAKERAARAEADAANVAKDTFLAMLSHELRTPLTPVVLTLETVVRDPSVPPHLCEELEMVRRNIELEARLIDDLLDLSRAVSGKLRLDVRPAFAHELLRHVLSSCARDISDHRLHVRLEADADSDRVSADSSRLQQVFWNLLRNAIKYTPEGGSVLIRTENTADGQFVARFIDTGIGITADAMPRIFNAFVQGDAAQTRRAGGLGLGLAIAKAIMEMHGGTIRAESDGADRGACLTIQLPLAPAAAPATAGAASAPGSQGDGRRARILLVEDHRDTARVLDRLLSSLGYAVKTAYSVEGALELAKSEEFDLLLSDIGLPDASGHDLMRRLRDGLGIKGVAISGYGMESDVAKSREAGFADHVTKPVSFPRLQSVIQRVLEPALNH